MLARLAATSGRARLANFSDSAEREEALARFPERGDHETSTFPELAAEGRLLAYRHEGLWLTVNTPKDLRRAEEYVSAHPDWLVAAGVA